MAIDPVGFKLNQPMTFNRYSYANNNPYKYIDPNGEAAILRNPVFAGAAVLLAGYAVYKYQTDPAAKKAIDSLVASSNGKMSTAEATVLYVAVESLIIPIIMNNADSISDDAVNGLVDGTEPANGNAGKKPGQREKSSGNAQADLESLPGTRNDNGTVTLPDGSIANVHSSGGGKEYPKGTPTLEIDRPKGKQDIKIRYPEN